MFFSELWAVSDPEQAVIGQQINTQFIAQVDSQILASLKIQLSIPIDSLANVQLTSPFFEDEGIFITFATKGSSDAYEIINIVCSRINGYGGAIELLSIMTNPIGEAGTLAPITLTVTDAVASDGTPLFFSPATHIVKFAPDPLEVKPLNIPKIRVGQQIHTILKAQGGFPPFSWELINGNLPNGLTLHPTGVLEGKPQEVDSETIGVQVTDSEGTIASTDLKLSVHSAPLQLLTSTLPPIMPGREYSANIEFIGGLDPLQPWVWDIENTGLFQKNKPPRNLEITGRVDESYEGNESISLTLEVFDNEELHQHIKKTIEIPVVPLLPQTTIEFDNPKAIAVGQDLIQVDYNIELSTELKIAHLEGEPDLPDLFRSQMFEILRALAAFIERLKEYAQADPDPRPPLPDTIKSKWSETFSQLAGVIVERLKAAEETPLPEVSAKDIKELSDWLMPANSNHSTLIKRIDAFDKSVNMLITMTDKDVQSSIYYRRYYVDLFIDGRPILRVAPHRPQPTNGFNSKYDFQSKATESLEELKATQVVLFDTLIAVLQTDPSKTLLTSIKSFLTNDIEFRLTSLNKSIAYDDYTYNANHIIETLIPGKHHVYVVWHESHVDYGELIEPRGTLQYKVSITPINPSDWQRLSGQTLISGEGVESGHISDWSRIVGSDDVDIVVKDAGNKLAIIPSIGNNKFGDPQTFSSESDIANIENLSIHSLYNLSPFVERSSIIGADEENLYFWINSSGHQFNYYRYSLPLSSPLQANESQKILTRGAIRVNKSAHWLDIICGHKGKIGLISELSTLLLDNVTFSQFQTQSPIDYDPVSSILTSPHLIQNSDPQIDHLLITQKMSGIATIYKNEGNGSFREYSTLEGMNVVDPGKQPIASAMIHVNGEKYVSIALSQARSIMLWKQVVDSWTNVAEIDLPIHPDQLVNSIPSAPGFVVGGYLSPNKYVVFLIDLREGVSKVKVSPFLTTDSFVNIVSCDDLMAISSEADNLVYVYR